MAPHVLTRAKPVVSSLLQGCSENFSKSVPSPDSLLNMFRLSEELSESIHKMFVNPNPRPPFLQLGAPHPPESCSTCVYNLSMVSSSWTVCKSVLCTNSVLRCTTIYRIHRCISVHPQKCICPFPVNGFFMGRFSDFLQLSD